DQDDRRGRLHEELFRSVGAEEIVVDAESDDERAAGENGEEVGEIFRYEYGGVRIRREEHERKAEAEDDGQSAHARRRFGVLLALVGMIDRSDFLSDPLHRRGGDE